MSAVGQTNPFSDASEYNSLAFIIARATDEMQTVSIVQVKAVDTAALTVDVQVLVNLMTGANISVPHGVISARPYYRAQGGTSGIILDPVVGDIGVMVFASRDSSAVVSAKGLANPGSQRRFSWSDGIYFGGVLNTTPTQYLKFAGGGITLLSPTAINLQSPANKSTGPFECTGVATFDTDVHILGDLFLTGVLHGSSAIFSGNVTAASFTGGGGGGGGTVTSVGISTPGTGVVVGGGPISTSGTLTVDLSSSAYAALALAVTALQSISIATGTGLTGGPLTASGTTVALSAATIASLLPASPVQGDIVYYTGSAWANLAPGTAGYVLQTGGAGANPSWVAAGGGGGGYPLNFVQWYPFESGSSNATTYTVTFPHTAAASGNTLFMFVSADGSGSFTAPGGWTVDINQQQNSFSRFILMHKTSASDTSAVLTSANSSSFSGFFFEVTGSHALDQSSSAGVANQQFLNFSSITPTSGAAVFAVMAYTSGTGVAFTQPNEPACSPTWKSDYIQPNGSIAGRGLLLLEYLAASNGAIANPPYLQFPAWQFFSGGGLAYSTFSIL